MNEIVVDEELSRVEQSGAVVDTFILMNSQFNAINVKQSVDGVTVTAERDDGSKQFAMEEGDRIYQQLKSVDTASIPTDVSKALMLGGYVVEEGLL